MKSQNINFLKENLAGTTLGQKEMKFIDKAKNIEQKIIKKAIFVLKPMI
jgi:hypothetical protein